ncbi:Uncharacterised protein [uncultured archaeon]|nr:Uncharacterised protein [uncultured archaeon]
MFAQSSSSRGLAQSSRLTPTVTVRMSRFSFPIIRMVSKISSGEKSIVYTLCIRSKISLC